MIGVADNLNIIMKNGHNSRCFKLDLATVRSLSHDPREECAISGNI